MRAVENALQITIPNNARILRNMIAGIQYVQDHVIHFYHLPALDWVDVVSALSTDPAATATLAQSISPWPQNDEGYFQSVKQQLTTFVNSGQLGIFANGYWGNPAYKLPPEANLMAVGHYLQALDWQKDVIRVHAILGGKNPHPQTYLVGGMASVLDPNSEGAVNTDMLALIRQLFSQAQTFVDQVYIPDLLAVASFYPEYTKLGEGLGNFMAYGDFPDASGNMLFPSGLILGRDLTKVVPFDPSQIAENVAHSWYTYTGGDTASLNPFQGETKPNYTGPQPPYQNLDTGGKYSWVKAPRYNGTAVEVGPLARVLVAYASGQPDFKNAVDGALAKLGVGADALFSTLGRTAARGLETMVVAGKLQGWVDELETAISTGDLSAFNGEKWDPSVWPRQAQGFGLVEAPRGALGHWVVIQDGKVARYQAVVPSTWNASPRDAGGQKGAYEAALPGTTLAVADQPLEILRTIHSFDPCLACAVHVVDPSGRELTRVELEGSM